VVGCFSGRLHHLMKLPARSGDAGSEPRVQPRSSASTPSHTLHRKAASGRAICCPSDGKVVNIYLHEADQVRIRELATYLANEGLRV
jgi:hypothetical protein